MKIEMKKINYKILLGILLLVALIGAVVLVQQKQETRRGATSLDGFIRLSLEDSSTTKQLTAGEFTVPIVANVTGAGGVDSVVAYFCYDPTKIELKNVSDLEKSFTLIDPAQYVGGSVKVEESNNKCVKVTFVSIKQGKRMEAKVVDINFKTVASSGTGTITIDKSKSSLGVAGQDAVDINSVGNLNYSIGGSVGDCTPTSNNSSGCSSNYGCMKIDGNYLGVDGDCKNPVKGNNPGAIKYLADPSCPPISDDVLAILGDSGDNKACKTIVAGDSTVNIKLAFAGVKSGECATNWQVALRMADSSGKNVLDATQLKGIPTKTDKKNSNGEVVYNFSVAIDGIPEAGVNKSSFFLTGPKHIPLKYGKNNQTGWYSIFVGDISLIKGKVNTYDFSEFPLIAGDLTGDTAGTPDGKIDGRDFSYLKEKANDLLPAAAAGTNVAGDIDGNCQANAGDIRLFKELLKEVNGQTY